METKKPTASFNLVSVQISLKKAFMPIMKHSTVIILVASVGILIYAIITVQATISSQDDAGYRNEQLKTRISGNFDKETINKINNLKASSDGSIVTLPDGRRNPFIN